MTLKNSKKNLTEPYEYTRDKQAKG